jgi:hypothetical protein
MLTDDLVVTSQASPEVWRLCHKVRRIQTAKPVEAWKPVTSQSLEPLNFGRKPPRWQGNYSASNTVTEYFCKARYKVY